MATLRQEARMREGEEEAKRLSAYYNALWAKAVSLLHMVMRDMLRDVSRSFI